MRHPDEIVKDAKSGGILKLVKVAVGADDALEKSAVTYLENVNHVVRCNSLAAVTAMNCIETLALVDTNTSVVVGALFETSTAVDRGAFEFGETVSVNAGLANRFNIGVAVFEELAAPADCVTVGDENEKKTYSSSHRTRLHQRWTEAPAAVQASQCQTLAAARS